MRNGLRRLYIMRWLLLFCFVLYAVECWRIGIMRVWRMCDWWFWYRKKKMSDSGVRQVLLVKSCYNCNLPILSLFFSCDGKMPESFEFRTMKSDCMANKKKYRKENEACITCIVRRDAMRLIIKFIRFAIRHSSKSYALFFFSFTCMNSIGFFFSIVRTFNPNSSFNLQPPRTKLDTSFSSILEIHCSRHAIQSSLIHVNSPNTRIRIPNNQNQPNMKNHVCSLTLIIMHIRHNHSAIRWRWHFHVLFFV